MTKFMQKYKIKTNLNWVRNQLFGLCCCGSWTLRSRNKCPLWDSAQTFNKAVGAPDCLGKGRDPTASSILTPHKSCDLRPPMRGTQQNWNLV